MCVTCMLAVQGDKPLTSYSPWVCDDTLNFSGSQQSEQSIVAIPGPSLRETTDAAASSVTTYTLGEGSSYIGSLSVNGDVDYYKVNLQAGQTYTFVLTGVGKNNVVDPILRLFSADGVTKVAENDDGLPGGNSIIQFTPSISGTYYLSAGAYIAGDIGEYGISVTQGTKADLNITLSAGIIDSDYAWNSTPGTSALITYAFRDSPASYSATSNIASFSKLTAAQIAVVEDILALWSSVANVTFQRVNPTGYSNDATIVIGNYTDTTDGAGAFAYYPGSTASSSPAGDVWLNLNSISTTTIPRGSYSYLAIMHELGHALGLSHPGLYNASATGTITYNQNAQFIEDTGQYSIMSYFFSGVNTGAYFMGQYASTPQVIDIAAIQNIYGANTATRSGDTVYGVGTNAGPTYDFVANTRPVVTIWDGGGNDAIDVSNYASSQTIDLREGNFSSIYGLTNNLAIAVGAVIENAVGGSGADTIYGNAGANFLSSGLGNDRLFGFEGRDKLIGGGGNDILDGGLDLDTAVLGGLRSAWSLTGTGLSFTLQKGTEIDTFADIERLQFDDGTIAFDTAGSAGISYRLYQASFDRMPDTQGLSYWVSRMDLGMDLREVALRFMDSNEFRSLYGTSPTDAQFVTALYANVHHRAPDTGGFNFWVNSLATGTFDRADVLLRFSESVENIGNVASSINGGMWLSNEFLTA